MAAWGEPGRGYPRSRRARQARLVAGHVFLAILLGGVVAVASFVIVRAVIGP